MFWKKFAALVGIAGVGFVVVLMTLPTPAPPVVVLPNPNGYDDFLQAAQVVSGTMNARQAKGDELRVIVRDVLLAPTRRA